MSSPLVHSGATSQKSYFPAGSAIKVAAPSRLRDVFLGSCAARMRWLFPHAKGGGEWFVTTLWSSLS